MRIRERFNPRAPCGARPFLVGDVFPFMIFQPTRPLRGATIFGRRRFSVYDISTHAPLAGRDFMCSYILTKINNFNPRAPCGARLAVDLVVAGGQTISTHAPLAGRDKSG